MRAGFASELSAIETQVCDDLKSAVMTLAIVSDSVEGPMSVWSDTIAHRADELRHASRVADTELVRITARQNPVAGDLRRVLALIQMAQHAGLLANQFELISEQLRHVGARLSNRRDAGETLSEMARLAGDQLHRSIRAFVTRDVQIARDIDRDDDAIDRLNRVVFELALALDGNHGARELAMRHVLIARSLERIGDNAVDIAEQVVLLVRPHVGGAP